MNIPISFGKKNTTTKKKKEKDPEFKGNNMFVPEQTSKPKKSDVELEKVNIKEISQESEEIIGPQPLPKSYSIDELPLTKEFLLEAHKKAITAVGLDRSGTRMVTGSQDGSIIKFYDFSSMDQSMKHFRDLDCPCGFIVMNQITFNKKGDLFVLVPNGVQPKLFTRDAALKGDFQVGDKYITDMGKTHGHVGFVTGIDWNPVKKNHIITSSQDTTIRVWDAENVKTKNLFVIKARGEKGYKVPITACAYDHYGMYIAGGCFDGSIQIWDEKGPYHRPSLINKAAHEEKMNITSLKFSRDDHTLISRAMDNTLKIWDIRKFEKPTKEVKNLLNLWEQTDCLFSEDDKLIITGTSAVKQGAGDLVFIDKDTLEIVHTKTISSGSVIRVIWNPLINQFVVGSSDHNIHFFYDEERSKNGILNPLKKEVRKKYVDEELMYTGQVFVPNALPMFKPGDSESLKKYRERKDPVKTRIPEKPDTTIGPGYRGKIGTSVNHYLLKESGLVNNFENVDPREAILKFAKEAEENPTFIDNAYKKTQPVKYFDVSHFTNEQNEEESAEDRFGKKRKTE